MKNKLLLLFSCYFSLASGVQAKETDFDKFKKQYLQKKSKFVEQYKQDFDQYKTAYRQDLANFKAKIKDKWGYADVNTSKKLVVYSDSLNEKVIVDYANNEIIASSTSSDNSANQVLQKLVYKTLKTPISELTSEQSAVNLNDKTVTLADSLGIDKSEVTKVANQVTSKTEDIDEVEVVQANIEDLKTTEQKIQNQITQLSEDEQLQEQSFIEQVKQERRQAEQYLASLQADPTAKKTTVRKVSFSSSRWQKSSPYRSFVIKQSKEYNLPQSLVYAIMETESSFNPAAQSPIPAFGLMQVVPTTAGIDVHRYLNNHNTRQAPSKEELFTPKTNVLYGSTYMNLLLSRYFKNIKDPESRLYCAVAAYNTGPGNVAQIFNQGRNKRLKTAVEKINQLKPEQVYNSIKAQAHPETQRYITKVMDAKSYYEKQI